MNSSNSSPISQDNHEIIAKKPFWKAIAEIGAKVPVEEWDKLPRDFARNFEHYMYGAPRDEDDDNE